jgi:MYXO-CTERM domain-containing protein
MKTLLLLSVLLLFAAPAFGGEGGTGFGGPPGTPEPSSIGLLGAAALFGIPAWRYYRRRKSTQDKDDDPQQ